MKKPSDAFDDESPKTDDKKKLSSILLKHRNVLKLKTVASVLKESSKKQSKEGPPQRGDSTVATETNLDKEIDPKAMEENWRKINLMVKDVSCFHSQEPLTFVLEADWNDGRH